MKKVISVMLLISTFLLQSITVCAIGEIKHEGITYRHVGNKLLIAKIDPWVKTLDIKKRVTIGDVEYIVSSITSGALNKSNVEVVNLPEEGIDVSISAFRDSTKLNTVKNLDKANIVSTYGLFSGCCNLRNIELPENLEMIGGSMFCGCTALENITIKKSITKIDEDGFLGCSSLNKVNVESESRLKHIGKGAFAGCENLEYFDVPKNLDIAEYAFFGCKKLSSDCNIPKSVITYDKNLEEKCKKAELFARKILENEVKSGRDSSELIDAKEIDKLLYKYIPKSTDVLTVVSKEEFDKITSDGRLVLYRGDIPCLGKSGRKITIKEINDAFKYGNFYYPFECNGIFCTKYVEHALSLMQKIIKLKK